MASQSQQRKSSAAEEFRKNLFDCDDYFKDYTDLSEYKIFQDQD